MASATSFGSGNSDRLRIVWIVFCTCSLDARPLPVIDTGY
jgi:hypothetical protein